MEHRGKKSGARDLALAALTRVEATDAFADLALEELFKRHRPGASDRGLAMELTFGALRWQALLDYRIAEFTDRPIKKLERQALIALRLGAYQLLMLDRIPARAAVNESVALAPARARGLVNAVLRRLADNSNSLAPLTAIADEVERLAVAESHPPWMVRDWIDRLGYEGAEALCRANNARPDLALRVNARRTGREAFLRLLAREGVEARPGRWSPLAVVLTGSRTVADLPGYDDGLFAVQDEASQLAPLILDPRPGETVLDACAAPGTKSFALMELMEERGRVVALDLHEARLARMAEESRRLGLTGITRVAGDAAKEFEFGESGKECAIKCAGKDTRAPILPEKFRGVKFDRILVDAPCTGLGTIRRRPEIKWRRKPEDAGRMAVIQANILGNVAQYLKPGGALVYSTCTFTPEENEAVIARLLESGHFEQDDPATLKTSLLKRGVLASLTENKILRAWPHLSGTDGFTIFRVRKI